MYHIFIHSPADGHAGLFSFLAIVNTAATKWISWYLGVLTWDLWGECPAVVHLGHMADPVPAL